MSNELLRVLTDLGIQDLFCELVTAGFSSWERLTTITEQDMANLNIRRGVRRKLQRAIARSMGWPDSRPLPSPIELEYFCQRQLWDDFGHHGQ